ncbi:cholesterol oxidase substrate-binding domain-containing protein [Streptomyces sp. NPDC005485]|uniref:cholesterol oxidase substrate-binding domain-containing protein n=1 Tax=Streptomyces sp. NPDC005485 TaxID=3155591 RepID=UPI0033BBD130
MIDDSANEERAPWSRRGFILTAASLVAGTQLVPVARAAAAAALPGFPEDVDVYRSVYRNWVGEINAEGLWACAPADSGQVVAVVNWAWKQGWTVRARGSSHGWAPLTIPEGTASGAPVLLVDTATHLTGVSLESADPAGAAVRAGTGVTLEALLGHLEDHGLGLTAAPAPGDLTLGGALAIDAHGTAVPADGESRLPGHTYGSLSNLVLSITAVVWDDADGAYVLRTYDRDDADGAALLTHLGRALVTEVVLRVGANTNLRCVSRTDIPAAELFAAPGGDGDARTFASFLDEAGRAEAIWFAFTEFPWLKVWSVAPRRPLTSRRVTSPYNYPFSDNVPTLVADLAGRMLSDAAWYLAPVLGNAQLDAAVLGLTATLSADIWGPSKNTLLYIKPTTLRVTANGYAVLTSRSEVQRVVAEFTAFFRERLAAYAATGRYPVNGQVEIRTTGLDDPSDVASAGARAPLLSALRPRADHPEWDTAVWLDVLTLPGTPHAEEFYRKLEQFLLTTYDGGHALARVEWSKGWAYTKEAGWSDPEVLGTTVPASFDDGAGPDWSAATAVLDRLDPHRVYDNALLRRLFP